MGLCTLELLVKIFYGKETRCEVKSKVNLFLFLNRENLDWVGKATNWAKFTAVASLGVIHKGHEGDAMRLLETYLPKENVAGSSGYMEGGSLYALGKLRKFLYFE